METAKQEWAPKSAPGALAKLMGKSDRGRAAKAAAADRADPYAYTDEQLRKLGVWENGGCGRACAVCANFIRDFEGEKHGLGCPGECRAVCPGLGKRKTAEYWPEWPKVFPTNFCASHFKARRSLQKKLAALMAADGGGDETGDAQDGE